MTLLLLSALASAGNLTVETSGSVMVSIDGTIQEFPEGRQNITAYALDRGRHLVEVRNLMGQRLTEIEVEIPWNERVTVAYRKKHLEVVGSELLPGHEAPPPPVAPSVVAQTTVVPAVEEPKELEVTLPETVSLGSIEVVGPARYGMAGVDVWVEGNQVPINKQSGSYVVSGLFPREVAVKVVKAGKTVHDGPLEVKGNQNTRCLLSIEDNTLGCRASKPGLGQTTIQTTKLPPEHLKLVYEEAKRKAEEEAAKEPAGPVEVVFTLSDPLDFCNLYIGGVKALEFRKGQPLVQSRTLVVGMHPIAVKDFTDTEVWADGKLVVTSGEPIQISFGHQGLQVDNREEAWVE